MRWLLEYAYHRGGLTIEWLTEQATDHDLNTILEINDQERARHRG